LPEIAAADIVPRLRTTLSAAHYEGEVAMKRIPKLYAACAIALAFLLILSTPVFAENFAGMLSSVEPDDHLFTVVDDNGDARDFRLRVDGQVFINDELRTIWDLTEGDRVSVTYEVDSATGLIATVIRCTRN
jgi:hypothetical protein